MTDARRTHEESSNFSRWLTDRHHSNYGENDYVVLKGNGEPGHPGFTYTFRAHLMVGGGTGNGQNALRRVLEEDQQIGKAATTGVQHWLVIGPAHDGERRAVLYTTDTRTDCKIKANDGAQHNDARTMVSANRC